MTVKPTYCLAYQIGDFWHCDFCDRSWNVKPLPETCDHAVKAMAENVSETALNLRIYPDRPISTGVYHDL